MEVTIPAPLDYPSICDLVFSTCVADERGQVATMRWARTRFFGVPLLLLDWGVAQLTPALWLEEDLALSDCVTQCRSRHGTAGMYVEGEGLAAQAVGLGLRATPILEHLTKPDAWPSLCLSASFAVKGGNVKVSRVAHERSKGHRYTGFLGNPSGPRGEDPTVPAFVYGVVIGLDAAFARPPRPAKLRIAA